MRRKIYSSTTPSPVVLRWYILMGLTGLALMLLMLPLAARDFLILVLATCIALAAIRDFATVWLGVIAFLPIIFLTTNMFGQEKVTGLRIIITICIISFLASQKPPKFWLLLRKRLIFLSLVSFCLGNFISALASGNVEAIYRAMTYLEPFSFFLLSYYVVRSNPNSWRLIFLAILFSGVYVICFGLLELISKKSVVELLNIRNTIYPLEILQSYLNEDRFGIGGRISSFLLQPVYAGLYLGVLLICQTYYVFAFRKENRGWLLISIPLILLMLILTGSRGPIIGLVFSGVAFILFNKRKVFAFGVTFLAATLIIFIILLTIPHLGDFFLSSFLFGHTESSSYYGRLDLTEKLLSIFMQRPVFGYGPGLIQKAALKGFFFKDLVGLENQYAVLLADGGLVAAIPWFCFVFATFHLAAKTYLGMERNLQFAGTMMFSLTAYYLIVTVSVNATNAVGGFLFFIVVGGLAGLVDAEIDKVGKAKQSGAGRYLNDSWESRRVWPRN